MSRPALRARVDAAGTVVDVLRCHLKSKLLTSPDGRFSTTDEDERARYAVYALGRRAAEAATVRGLVTRPLAGRGQHRAVIVLGDLNDTEHFATTTLLNGPGGSEIGTAGFHRPDHGDATRLWNLAPAIPTGRRFSRTYRGRRELIDHILISHALLTGLGTVDTGATSITDTPPPAGPANPPPTTAPSWPTSPPDARSCAGSPLPLSGTGIVVDARGMGTTRWPGTVTAWIASRSIQAATRAPAGRTRCGDARRVCRPDLRRRAGDLPRLG